MSEPRIINRIFPWNSGGDYGLYSSPLVSDNDILPLATSVGANSDGTLVYGSYGDGVTAFECDGVIWMNHNTPMTNNISNYTVTNNGSAITGKQLFEAVDPSGRQTTTITFPTIATVALNVGTSTTTPSNIEKTLGELYIYNENTISLTSDFSSYSEHWREKMKEIHLGDGGIHRVTTVSPSGKYIRYEANCQFRFLSEADVNSLMVLKDSGEPFYFQPEKNTAPWNIYYCHWTGPMTVQYSAQYKGAGYTVSMDIKEVK